MKPGSQMKDLMPITPARLKPKQTRGFTVTELLVALAILALALGVVLPTSFFLIRSNIALWNSTVLTTQGRHLVEQLGSDIRSTVNITRNGDHTLELTTEDPDNNRTTVLYFYDIQTNTLSRKVGNGRARTIMDDIVGLNFVYYNSQDLVTTKLIDTKKVGVQMTLKSSSILGKSQTYEQKSTRFVMRNRLTPTNAWDSSPD